MRMTALAALALTATASVSATPVIAAATQSDLGVHLAKIMSDIDGIFGSRAQSEAAWIRYRSFQGRADGLIALAPQFAAAARARAAELQGENRNKAEQMAAFAENAARQMQGLKADVEKDYAAFRALPVALDHLAGDRAYADELARHTGAASLPLPEQYRLFIQPIDQIDIDAVSAWQSAMTILVSAATKFNEGNAKP
jgi:hypothetical protein